MRLPLIIALLLVMPAWAQDDVPIPLPRPDIIEEEEEAPVPQPRPDIVEEEEEALVPLPRPRPEEEEAPEEDEEGDAPEDVPEEGAIEAAPVVPDRVYRTACPALLAGLVEATAIDPISDGVCEARSPLLVEAVLANGRMVPLSSPATLNCEMASALPRWLESLDGHIAATMRTRLARVDIGTSHFCRPRNNVPGAFFSEHGFANALDVVGFTLENGDRISVLTDWMPAGAAEGRFLRFAHGAACTGFTTVLGPEANAAHADHFHLDLGCHGRSCTSRICR